MASCRFRQRRWFPIFGPFVLHLLGLTVPSIVASPVAAADVIVVEVSAEPRDIDAESVRDAIGNELGMIAVPPADSRATRWTPTLHVLIDRSRGDLGIQYEEGSNLITRHVRLPADRGAIIRTAAFLAGNVVRNEATELLQELRSRPRHEEPNPTAEDLKAEEAARRPPSASAGESRASDATPPRRMWLGAAIQLDLMYFPQSSHVCPTDEGDTGYVCTDDHGSVVDQVSPRENQMRAGLAPAKVRFVFSADLPYADQWLFGGRIGFTPGQHAPEGRGLGGFLFELRATYVFGNHPLARIRVAPYVVASLGVSDFDADVQITVLTPRALEPVDARAFRRAGPILLSTGAGFRVPLASRAAIMATPIRFSAAFGSASGLVLSPEAGVQLGF